jgi:hypothetical protein
MSYIWLLNYIRLVSYAIVALASIIQLKIRTASPLIYWGNIFMAIMLMITVLIGYVFNPQFDMELIATLLTPTAVIWAVLNFAALIK